MVVHRDVQVVLVHVEGRVQPLVQVAVQVSVEAGVQDHVEVVMDHVLAHVIMAVGELVLLHVHNNAMGVVQAVMDVQGLVKELVQPLVA